MKVSYSQSDTWKYQLTVTDKAWTKLKQNLKLATKKTDPIALTDRIKKINEIQRGW